MDPDFATQWLNPNSNLRESIFEIQYVTNGKNWDESTGWNGVWFISSSDGGYGFHLPTQHLLDALTRRIRELLGHLFVKATNSSGMIL